MKNRPEIGDPSESGHISANFVPIMASTAGSYQVHTAERGPHWIGWITRDEGTKPEQGVVLVAANRAEAEARARQWAEQRGQSSPG